MDSGAWIIIVSFALIILLFAFLRPRGGPRKYPEIIQFILYDIKLNKALADTFLLRDKPRKFEINNWELNKGKIGFLTETQRELLRETFTLAGEFNVVIKEDRKNKSDSYKSLDLTHFKELLDKCEQELEDWMITNTGQKEYTPKYPSISGFFFGER